MLAINAADDERNPPELGVMDPAIARIKNARYVLLPITAANRGHSTTYNASLWSSHLSKLLGEVR